MVLTLLFEVVTVVFRYGLGLESSRDTASRVAPWTFGLRIHHSYIGLLIVVLGLLVVPDRLPPAWRAAARWLVPIGLALIASDLIHHFLVLWPIEGSPHFDLVYPESHVAPRQGG